MGAAHRHDYGANGVLLPLLCCLRFIPILVPVQKKGSQCEEGKLPEDQSANKFCFGTGIVFFQAFKTLKTKDEQKRCISEHSCIKIWRITSYNLIGKLRVKKDPYSSIYNYSLVDICT